MLINHLWYLPQARSACVLAQPLICFADIVVAITTQFYNIDMNAYTIQHSPKQTYGTRWRSNRVAMLSRPKQGTGLLEADGAQEALNLGSAPIDVTYRARVVDVRQFRRHIGSQRHMLQGIFVTIYLRVARSDAVFAPELLLPSILRWFHLPESKRSVPSGRRNKNTVLAKEEARFYTSDIP
jgi:hypothetical protein